LFSTILRTSPQTSCQARKYPFSSTCISSAGAKQGDLATHRRLVIGRQVVRRRLRREAGGDVDRDLVDRALAARLALQQRPDPVVAEILEQQQALRAIDRERTRRMKAAVEQVARDGQERAEILVLRRRVHQHRAAAVGGLDPKIAAEAGVAGERADLCAAPAMRGEKIGRRSGRNHGRGGHRAPQAGGTIAVKARPPS
jgi:hypothetical protein